MNSVTHPVAEFFAVRILYLGSYNKIHIIWLS